MMGVLVGAASPCRSMARIMRMTTEELQQSLTVLWNNGDLVHGAASAADRDPETSGVIP